MGKSITFPQKSGDCKPVVQPLHANALWTVKRNPPQIKMLKMGDKRGELKPPIFGRFP